MFGGYSAPADTTVSSYADAEEVLERFSKTPTGRARKFNYYGYRMGRTSTVRKIGDAIAFRLHSTDCVTWYPDNSFALKCWESMTTSQFSSHFTPVSVGATGIITFDGPEMAGRDPDDWRARWRSRQLCHGSVRFTQADDGRWVPDEDTCDTFTTLQLDSRGARGVSKAHHLGEFVNFMQMATHIAEIEHEGVDLEACAEALLQRRYLQAAKHLPLVEQPKAFGVRLKPYRLSTPRDKFVTPTSIQRLKDWLYDQEGLLTHVDRKIMGYAEYHRLVQRNAAYGRVDVGGWRLGWR